MAGGGERAARRPAAVWGAGVVAFGMAVVMVTAMRAALRPQTVLMSAKTLGAQAHGLEAKAAQFLAAAHQAKAEAANVQAIEMYLHTAQSELNAYGANIEGLVAASKEHRRREAMAQFPKEAAELHALLDHSLGEADGAAVKIARLGGVSGVAVAAPGGLAKAKTHQQALRATVAKRVLHSRARTHGEKPQTNLDKVESTLKRLGAVKKFAREAAHGKARSLAAAALLGSVQSAAAHGVTHALQQQPSPLLGAMNVHDGELTQDDPKYEANTVDLTKESPAFKEAEDRVTPVFDPNDDKLLACDEVCQREIVHSTLGVTFKTATKCVPGCAQGDYTMRTHGAPLPEWSNEEQLKEQDAFCDNDPVYMKCKSESLGPLCDKLVEFMPQYCLEYSNEGICQQCSKVQLYEEREKARFKEDCEKFEARHHSDSLVVVPEGCAEVLEVGSWQNATSPEAMASAVEAQEEPRLF